MMFAHDGGHFSIAQSLAAVLASMDLLVVKKICGSFEQLGWCSLSAGAHNLPGILRELESCPSLLFVANKVTVDVFFKLRTLVVMQLWYGWQKK